jgi:putative transposase
MANTYTQIHIHAVFTVQNRICLIHNSWKIELYKYITGIIQGQKHKLIAINGTSDHIHALFGMRPNQALSDLTQDIKGDSSGWINKKGFIRGKFSWQEGYGAFSIGKEQIPAFATYIENQEEHHRKKSFLDEYRKLLEDHNIPYNESYIFEPVIT